MEGKLYVLNVEVQERVPGDEFPLKRNVAATGIGGGVLVIFTCSPH